MGIDVEWVVGVAILIAVVMSGMRGSEEKRRRRVQYDVLVHRGREVSREAEARGHSLGPVYIDLHQPAFHMRYCAHDGCSAYVWFSIPELDGHVYGGNVPGAACPVAGESARPPSEVRAQLEL